MAKATMEMAMETVKASINNHLNNLKTGDAKNISYFIFDTIVFLAQRLNS